MEWLKVGFILKENKKEVFTMFPKSHEKLSIQLVTANYFTKNFKIKKNSGPVFMWFGKEAESLNIF